LRLALTSGTMLAAAWPCMVRCQWSLEMRVGSCGTFAMAVGSHRHSQPITSMASALSGNHRSLQTAPAHWPTALSHPHTPAATACTQLLFIEARPYRELP